MPFKRVFLVCSAVLFVFFLSSPRAVAQKEFFIQDQTLLAGSVDQEILLEANSDITFLGFSFGILYDANVLDVKDVTWEGALADEPAFYEGRISDGMIGYGCVFDFGPFDSSIPPGQNIALTKIIVDVAPDIDTTTELTLEDVPIDPAFPVENLITNDGGFPETVDVAGATLTIETRVPVITAIQNNAGFPGDMFTITGEFFGEPGLEVTVCDTAAEFTLDADTLTVTAPECGTFGFAPVVVSTDRGSDSEANGFDYLVPVPEIVSIEGNAGRAGDVFVVTGNHLGEPGLEVKVCEAVAQATLDPDGITLSVTAPECASTGFARLEVCTVHGCDSEESGFDYLPPEAPEITSIMPDSGLAGTEITISGLNFDQEGREVKICDVVVEATLEADGTLTAVVPDCGADAASVVVEVCAPSGCDAEMFQYEIAGTPFRRGDAGNTGGVNISSAILLLNFLFTDLVNVLPCEEAGDIDNDGAVNISDPINLLNHLFGTFPPPAPPGLENCGLDPDEPGSPGDLGCETYTTC